MRRIVLIGGIFLGAANLASAQVASPILLSGKISEKYSDRTQISGVRIVGLMLGDVSMPLDYGNLRFSLPGLPEQRTICFAATSRDGLYSAAGSLSAPAGTRGLAAVSHTSTMHRQLAAYRSGDIVMRAHIGPECATSRNAPLIPLRYGSKGQVLQVAVNSVNAVGVSASLTLTNGQTISGVCSRERTGAAFDHICRLNIPERVSGRSKLILNYRERTLEQRKESVSVQW